MGENIRRIIFAVVVGILTALGLTGLFAWMIRREMLDPSHMDLMAACVVMVSAGVTAMACGRGEGNVKRTSLAETGFLLVLGCINLMLFEGALNGLIPCALLVAATAAAYILCGLGKTGKRKRKYGRSGSAVGKLNKKYRR